MKKIFILLSIISLPFLYGQQTPAKNQTQDIVITNCFIHIGNGTVIENGAIGFSNGKINYVGKNISKEHSLPSIFSDKNPRIINAEGKHIYPGFILTNTKLGITEIDAVRATHDYREVGLMNPNIKSQIAYNVQSKIIETVRTNGVLMTQVTPQGGIISGQSSVMYLAGWNWEDATCKESSGVSAFIKGTD